MSPLFFYSFLTSIQLANRVEICWADGQHNSCFVPFLHWFCFAPKRHVYIKWNNGKMALTSA
jgi:hypothetical protein